MVGCIRLVLEELVEHVAIPALDSNRYIRIVTEYSEENEKAIMTIRYNGAARDITENANELIMKLLRGITSSIRYAQTDSEETANEITVEIIDPKRKI